MTEEYWKTQDDVKAERERDEPRRRLRIWNEEYIANDRVARNLTSKRKSQIWERKVTTSKWKNEMCSILRSLTANRSVSTPRIINDSDKSFVSQKQKADGFIGLYRDVSNLKLKKHDRGM